MKKAVGSYLSGLRSQEKYTQIKDVELPTLLEETGISHVDDERGPSSSVLSYHALPTDLRMAALSTKAHVQSEKGILVGKASSSSSYNSLYEGGKGGYKRNFFVAVTLLVTLCLGLLSMGPSKTIDPDLESDPLLDSDASLALMKVAHDVFKNQYTIIDSSGINQQDNKDKSGKILVEGKYTLNVNNNGWHHLSLTVPPFSKEMVSSSSSTINSYIKSMEAMGLLEGFATCEQIQQYYVNFYSGLLDGGVPKPETVQVLLDNHDWMDYQATKNYKHSDYWLQVKGVLSQLKGLLEGVRRGCPAAQTIDDDTDDEAHKDHIHLHDLKKRPSLIHLLMLNANGDLYQIAAKYDQQTAPPSTDDDDDITDGSVTAETVAVAGAKEKRMMDSLLFNRRTGHKKAADFGSLHRRRGIDPSGGGSRETGVDHCSVIIKLLADRSDVLFGHNTWDDFQCLSPRIFKHYSHPLISDGKYLGKQFEMHFSSSPGFLTSIDDYFHVYGHAKLVVTETTNDLYNVDLLKLVVPESMLSWTRSRIANTMAKNGSDWATVFSIQHSGTYDNQWMVLDMDKFKPGNDPLGGFLTVVEEVPGYTHAEDMTAHLISHEYWASYNAPFFPDISDMIGSTALCEQNANFCYDSDPRARIFRERQSAVKDIDSLKLLMGYNRFQTDPIAMNDSCNAIACRQDLEPGAAGEWKYPFGATDAKCSSYTNAVKSPPKIFARLGPTHDDQAPFCWSPFDNGHKNVRNKVFVHEGHPECFPFEWEVFGAGGSV